jgi:hypothetical protein
MTFMRRLNSAQPRAAGGSDLSEPVASQASQVPQAQHANSAANTLIEGVLMCCLRFGNGGVLVWGVVFVVFLHTAALPQVPPSW